jgi:hypothetical protein
MSLIAPTTNPLLEQALLAKLQRRALAQGGLGELEPVAVRLGLVQHSLRPRLREPQLLVFAADHGLAVDGIHAEPGRQTDEMVQQILAGQQPISVFARQQGLNLSVVDCGVATQLPPHERLLPRKIAHGTRNARVGNAMSLEQAFGQRKPTEVFRFDAREKQGILDKLNSTGKDTKVDYVMLGCPHYSMEQLWELTQLIEGRQVHPDCELWIFTPRSTKALCDQNGFTRIIEAAGGHILSDSCSAMSRAMPKGTRVVAMDSAKQTHYLPAILGVQAWFGSTADCVEAACTGRWQGGLK